MAYAIPKTQFRTRGGPIVESVTLTIAPSGADSLSVPVSRSAERIPRPLPLLDGCCSVSVFGLSIPCSCISCIPTDHKLFQGRAIGHMAEPAFSRSGSPARPRN
jgi:hypothetical protein